MSGLVLGVEEHRHGKRHEPETEQQIVDPGNKGRCGEIVIDAESLRNQPQGIGCRGQTPERPRQPLGAAAGLDRRVDHHDAQGELHHVRQHAPGRLGSQGRDHADVRQPQQAGDDHDGARACQCSPHEQQLLLKTNVAGRGKPECVKTRLSASL